MNTEEFAEFEVTDHFYLKQRGGFVIGHIRKGTIRPGMVVQIRKDGKSLTISGVEFLDNITEKTFTNALVFQEKPKLEYFKKIFPIGSIIRADNAQNSNKR